MNCNNGVSISDHIEEFSYLATNPDFSFDICKECVRTGNCKISFPCLNCAEYIFEGKLGDGRIKIKDGKLGYEKLIEITKISKILMNSVLFNYLLTLTRRTQRGGFRIHQYGKRSG